MKNKVYLLAPNNDELNSVQDNAPENIDVIWVNSNQDIKEQAEQLKDAIGLIAIPSDISVELVANCPNLKLVQVISAGTNRIDVKSLGELGVMVANNGGGNAPSVAEHTIALMIGTYRKLHLQFQSVKDGHWMGDLRRQWSDQAHELTGKTVGIIGLGHIGRNVAKRLQGWDCDIIYHDTINFEKELEKELKVTKVSLDRLLRTSDVITLHVPLDKNTVGMIGEKAFDLMKPEAILINACRGPVVDEIELIRALEERKLAAAGLDVLEEEPAFENNPLLEMPNVLVTPHMAGYSVESHKRNRVFAVMNAARVTEGEEPQAVVLPV